MRRITVLCSLLLVSLVASLRAQDDALVALEEAAIQDAVDSVAPSVVQIETIGGVERLGEGGAELLVGTGPTTGLIISEDGWIISSAFNFAQKPASILIRLPGGKRAPAELVSVDKNCMLALLKIDLETLELGPLPVAAVTPQADVRVGQWSIALGRTFSGTAPNVSLGIVSAKNRIFGRAIQTDAKVSPSNYGGPLIDIRGRVMGVLVPLSAQADSEIGGVEWYDSGIGFAIPIDQVLRILPRMKEGEELQRGIMGVAFEGEDLVAEPVVSVVRANSPAFNAGIEVGDKIVSLNDRPTPRIVDVRIALGPIYAGEEIAVVLRRGEDERTVNLKLIGELEPYQHPSLGIIPKLLAADAEKTGVPIAIVLPESPAAEAGLEAGDVLTKVNGTDTPDEAALVSAVNAQKVGQEVTISYRRGDEEREAKATLAAVSNTVPEELPPTDIPAPGEIERPLVGKQTAQQLAEFENNYSLYVPENYHPGYAYGLAVYFHDRKGYDPEKIIERLKPQLDERGIILIIPESRNEDRWVRQETEFAGKLIDVISERYRIDPRRVATLGDGIGGSMALLMAFDRKAVVRGAAAVAPPGVVPPNDNEPSQRLMLYLAAQAGSERLIEWVGQAETNHYPVTARDLGEEDRKLNDEELKELFRWMATLGRT